MQTVRGAIRGVMRVLTAGLSPKVAGPGTAPGMTILDVLDTRTKRV